MSAAARRAAHEADPGHIARIKTLDELTEWLRGMRRPFPTTFLLAREEDFDVQQRMIESREPS